MSFSTWRRFCVWPAESEEATATAAEAVRLYERKGNVASAEAQALVEELRGRAP